MTFELPELRLPEELVDAIVARGWTSHGGKGGGGNYFFFDRPGFWLRLYKWKDNPLIASIDPETHACGTMHRVRYADHQQPPSFTGRGARARAKAWADALIDEYIGWLADLGITLDHVSARIYTGSGRGGFVSGRTYRVDSRMFH